MSAHDLTLRVRRFWHKLVLHRFVHLTRPFRRWVRDFRRSSEGESRERRKLLDELCSLFLSELVAGRIAYLSQSSGGAISPQQEEALKQGYSSRLAQALKEEAAIESKYGADWAAPLAAGNLDQLSVLGRLTPVDFRAPREFAAMLKTVLRWWGEQSYRKAGPPIAGVMLRALQRVALGVIREDYSRDAIPPTTREAIRHLLKWIDRLARALRPARPPLPYLKAEAILQVAEARSEGRVWLPLRPIPTAALSFENDQQRYPGRSDEEAQRLARQIRHADGAILTTGYRGVGKSTFVNRVLYHTIAAQSGTRSADWLVVPVTISLAKVAGVRSILRLTVKAVHGQLLNSDATARAIPGRSSRSPLPLTNQERALLQGAYERSTLKVALTREETVEQKQEAGVSLKLDPGKLVGLSIGDVVSIGGSRSQIRKMNRQLSLLDYDENAAEEDLSQLIRLLSQERPLRRGGSNVRIKLVFVFDELDKMDIDKGLKPMIEGLKNLFLQQHAVFILVTSKKFYYDLLGDRAKEDAILNSYFSAIVHVPLLTFTEVRKLLEHWVDADAVNPGTEPLNDAETKLLDLVARYLTYRSLGNPREIIRELRQMEVWSDSGSRPYLTDRISQLPEVPIFAAIQRAIELVAAPPISENDESDSKRGVTLVSERLKSDQARLEQLRRGLYILAEEIISRQTLSLKAEDLEELHKNNFSQLSSLDVVQIASRLGNQLKALSADLPPDVFAPLVATGNETSRFLLFELESKDQRDLVKATDEFYTLIGRRPSLAEPVVTPNQTQARDIQKLIADAKSLSTHGGRAELLSAINLVGEILERGGPAKTPDALKNFLLEVVSTDADAVYRQAAAARLKKELVFNAPNFDLTASISSEPDERVLSSLISLLAKASDEKERSLATNALLKLLEREKAPATEGVVSLKLTDEHLVDLLTTLQTIAERDVTPNLLDWMARDARSDAVTSVFVRTFNTNASANGLNPVDRLLANEAALKILIARAYNKPPETRLPSHEIGTGLPASAQGSRKTEPLELWLRETLGERPAQSAAWLLSWSDMFASAKALPLVTNLWDIAVERSDRDTAKLILEFLAAPYSEPKRVMAKQALSSVRDFRTRALPYLKESLAWMTTRSESGSAPIFNGDQTQRIEMELDSIANEKERAAANLTDPYDGLRMSDTLFKPGGVSSTLPPTRAPMWPRAACAVIGVLALPAGLFLIGPEDLTARLTSEFLLRRLGMLLADAAGFSLLILIFRTATNELSSGVMKSDDSVRSSVTGSGAPGALKIMWNNVGVFALLGGVYWVHHQLGGSLSRSVQAGILGVNLLTIICLTYGLIPLFRKR